jgi:hypothetical protein
MHDLRFLAWLTGGEECRSPVALRDASVSQRVDYALRTPHAGARRRCAWQGLSHTAGVADVEGLVAVTLHLQLGALGVVAATRIGGHEAQLRLPGPPADPAGVGLTGGDLTAPSFQYMSDGERLRELDERPLDRLGQVPREDALRWCGRGAPVWAGGLGARRPADGAARGARPSAVPVG